MSMQFSGAASEQAAGASYHRGSMGDRLTPHEVRIAARAARYENATQERDNILRVDNEAFERVRVFESHMARDAQQFMDDNAIHTEAAELLETGLRQGVRYKVEDGGPLTREVAEEYQALRRDTLRAITTLERLAREAEWHIQRNESPYEAYAKFIERWPMLRPAIRVQ